MKPSFESNEFELAT